MLLKITIVVMAMTQFASGQLVGKCGDERAREFAKCCQFPTIIAKNATFPQNIAEMKTYCR